jgi:hypothetical protein
VLECAFEPNEHFRLVLAAKDRQCLVAATSHHDKMQYYQGKLVLTWWEGRVVAGHGVGEHVISDDSYREIARVRAGNGLWGDLHEFLITPQDTTLLVAYAPRRTDISPIGGPKDGMTWEGIVQEVDIQTGEVIFEWRSLEHVGIEESYVEPPEDPEHVHDCFHINSIDVEPDGNLLVCARNTWAVYKLDRKSGKIIWRLDGKKSNFEMGPDLLAVSDPREEAQNFRGRAPADRGLC